MDFILLLVVILVLNQMLLGSLANRFPFLSKKLLNGLFFYHLFFLGVYYLYSIIEITSDSFLYYATAKNIGEDWGILVPTGTDFIDNFSAIFVEFGLSYLSMMLLYAWFGYIGFVYTYIYFKENVPINVTVFGKYDLLKLLLFLPNMHFWTVSLGKGALIFMGLMMFAYAAKIPHKRIITLLVGGFFVYKIRPAVMLFVLVGVMVGILTGREKISKGVRILVIIAAVGFLFAASKTILAVANLQNSEDVVTDFQQFANVQSDRLEYSADSGVSMSSYPLPLKLFTLWFRPLFFDAPGALGLFSSVENLFYLILFLKIFNKRFIRSFKSAPYMVKMSAVTFLTASYAMTFIMSNLGIIMRQKSMVMYFGFFVIYYFLAEEEWKRKQLAGNVEEVNKV